MTSKRGLVIGGVASLVLAGCLTLPQIESENQRSALGQERIGPETEKGEPTRANAEVGVALVAPRQSLKVRELLVQLSGDDHEQRRSARTALARLRRGKPEKRQELISALAAEMEGEDVAIKCIALGVVCEHFMHEEALVGSVAKMLSGLNDIKIKETQGTRYRGATFLRLNPDRLAIPALLEALDDEFMVTGWIGKGKTKHLHDRSFFAEVAAALEVITQGAIGTIERPITAQQRTEKTAEWRAWWEANRPDTATAEQSDVSRNSDARKEIAE